uniref:FYVE-type domain-containing protein n=1 Tax=Hyaloperonospora arabidopsidis (strain Emoy2) TaxID=559515 RepID=M4BMW2_HYAAE
MMRSVHNRRAATLPTDGIPADSHPKVVKRRLTAWDELVNEPNLPTSRTASSPKLHLKDEEVHGFRDLAHSIVSSTLMQECEYRHLGSREPDEKQWKLLKRREDLSVYKYLPLDKSSSAFSVKCTGTLEGSLEDMLYGTHSKNRDEMRATAAYLHSSHMDCAVLNVLESGSDADPYNQLALKWSVAETFGDARLVNHRDWFNIESTGMGVDECGHRYGYFLARFAKHSGCPPMPDHSDVVRGKMAMCCIYRQEPESKVVSVYARGAIDLGGGMPAFVTSSASCAMMFSMAVAMESAAGKRLTKLALLRMEERAKKRDERKNTVSERSEVDLSRSQTITTSSVMDLLSASMVSSSQYFASDSKIKPPGVAKEPCHVCEKKPAMPHLVRSGHRKCGICHERTCSKCNIKRRLVGHSGPVSLLCCKLCIIQSRRLRIDPRDPCPILP